MCTMRHMLVEEINNCKTFGRISRLLARRINSRQPGYWWEGGRRVSGPINPRGSLSSAQGCNMCDVTIRPPATDVACIGGCSI